MPHNLHSSQIQQIRRVAAHVFHALVDETQHLVIEQHHHGRVLHHQAVHLGVITGALFHVIAEQGFFVEFVVLGIGLMRVIRT